MVRVADCKLTPTVIYAFTVGIQSLFEEEIRQLGTLRSSIVLCERGRTFGSQGVYLRSSPLTTSGT